MVAGLWQLHTWGQDLAARVRWIEQVLDLGITAFDHADIYGGYTVESLFGEALAAAPGLRERMTLVTKFGIRLVGRERAAPGAITAEHGCSLATAALVEAVAATRITLSRQAWTAVWQASMGHEVP